MIKTRVVYSLLAVATATLLLALVSWAVDGVRADPPSPDLARIGEETGWRAAEAPLSPDCVLDAGYQVYLCEPELGSGGAVAVLGATALPVTSEGGVLLIPDSTNKRIMAFDPVSGDLVDPVFIQLDDLATGTAIHALLGPNETLLISDQTRNVVHEYDLAGNYLGVFAPAGGADTDILQNIRGMALRPNGHLLVTVGAGSNANAIAEFDTDGNYVGNFVANGSGGLDSPFDIYERAGTDWLVSSISNTLIIRYAPDTGAPIGNLATINNFPQQIHKIGNGNVLVGNFSGTQTGVVELTAAGDLVDVHTAPGLASYRGVYELPGGTLLVSTAGGVFEIDRVGNLLDTKHTGQSRFIERVVLPTVELRKTVGLDPSICATTDEISAGPGTAVTYCYQITNTTPVTLTQHDLVDTHLGMILDGFAFNLLPEHSVFLTQTAIITETLVNTATWTAFASGSGYAVAATDAATVTVVAPSISLTKTVGLDPSVCAVTNAITVPANTAVTYCFEVTNTGATAFTQHDLVDNHLGAILDGFAFNLMPEQSVFLTQTAMITGTLVNTATWTAYNPGPTDMVSAMGVATVSVEMEDLEIYLPFVIRQ
jgi:hypothetical protein